MCVCVRVCVYLRLRICVSTGGEDYTTALPAKSKSDEPELNLVNHKFVWLPYSSSFKRANVFMRHPFTMACFFLFLFCSRF